MTVQVAHPKPEREVPDFVREACHKRLDQILGMYAAGEPLWIRTYCAFASTTHAEFQLDLTLREWF